MRVANGCPKSGTHALMALWAVEGGIREPGLVDGLHDGRSGRIRATSADPVPIDEERAAGLPDRHFIHGHVRCGVAVDWARVVTITRDPRAVLISYMRWRCVPVETALGRFFGRRFVDVYRSFLGWPEIVRYKDIAHVRAPLYAGRNNDTWTGAPTDWRAWWGETIDRAWRAAGGPELVQEAGYEGGDPHQ